MFNKHVERPVWPPSHQPIAGPLVRAPLTGEERRN
jgi:hypothetical protein